MRPFNNYETTQTISAREQLPVGVYICRILKAEEKVYTSSKGEWHKLEISFDIIEGDHRDFYAADYRSQSGEDKKWKGVLRMNIPSDDGSEADGWAKRSFKTNILAIEESNSGYHWDWNEAQLKGKTVGIVFRSEEWDYNNRHGWRTAPFKFVSVADAKSGNVKIPEPKPLNGSKSVPQVSASSAPDLSDFVEVASSELPF